MKFMTLIGCVFIANSAMAQTTNTVWEPHIEQSTMNGPKSFSIRSESQNVLDCSIGTKQPAIFVLGCDSRTFFDIVTQCDLSNENGYTRVAFRIDNNLASSMYMRIAAGTGAITSNDEEWAINFIYGIMHAKTLALQVQPNRGGIENITFDLRGLKENIPAIRSACNWPYSSQSKPPIR